MLENCLGALEGASGPRDKLARLIRAHLEFALEDMDRINVPDHEIGEFPGRNRSTPLEDRMPGFLLWDTCVKRS